MKIARKHILAAIEHALDVSGPITMEFKKYKIDASPYRIPKKAGNHGVRVTWEAVESH